MLDVWITRDGDRVITGAFSSFDAANASATSLGHTTHEIGMRQLIDMIGLTTPVADLHTDAEMWRVIDCPTSDADASIVAVAQYYGSINSHGMRDGDPDKWNTPKEDLTTVLQMAAFAQEIARRLDALDDYGAFLDMPADERDDLWRTTSAILARYL